MRNDRVSVGNRRRAMSQAPLLALLAVAAVTVWSYSSGLDAPFVLDDVRNIVDSPALHWTELSIDNVNAALESSLLRNRPVANISFALDHLAGGLEPRAFRVTNVVIHLLVGAALLWLGMLYCRFAQARGEMSESSSATLLMVSLPVCLFLVHPLNTQAVTYVVQRMASLAALFCIVAIACYLVARHRAMPRAKLWFGGSALALLLAMGTKENAVLVLPALLVYEACFFRHEWRSRAEHYFGRDWTGRWTLALWGGGAVVLLLLASVLMAGSDTIGLTTTFPARDFNGFERLLTQCRVQLFHLSQLVWPVPARLNLDHDFAVSRGLLNPGETLPAVIACVLLLAVAVWLAVRRPRYGYPLVAYALFHSIEAGPIGLEIIFEHRMYLPSAMLTLLLAPAIVDAPAGKRKVLLAFLSCFVIVGAAWTHARNQVWAEPLGIERDMALKSPGKARTQYNYAKALADTGQREDAVPYLQRAIAIAPDEERLGTLLGEVLLELQRPGEAVTAYRQALRLAPDSVRPALGLGEALAATGEEQAAFEHYLATGIRLARGGRPWEAMPVLAAAIELRADDPVARNALGNTYAGAGLAEKAIEQFSLSLKLDPDQHEARFNLAVTAEKLGRRDEAVRAYREFVERAPARLQGAVERARQRLLALSTGDES